MIRQALALSFLTAAFVWLAVVPLYEHLIATALDNSGLF